ncbi:hybrid sensor histidine kinase/response regulator transcription factor [Alteromonas oceanisediminis]|uniref:hybrid sensor histidine kinase/response regulator transcription factor n=1 Tax=Alteromonas oceanisediminis TaxID=2836180 RepID=UPI001BD93B24|nr:ATP-binding protein [Alteromonas oceanisediminis]MBT0587917.1 response regulator [Alteromonas oceanisediminis]
MTLNGLFVVFLAVFVALTAGHTSAIETNPLKSITKVNGQPLGLISSVHHTNGRLLIGSENGLFVLEGDRAFSVDSINHIIDAPVQTILETPSGELIVGTYGEGIFKLDRQLNVMSQLNAKNGLSSDYTFDLVLTGQGRISAANLDGLDIIDINSQTVDHLHQSGDGNVNALALLDEQTLIYGSHSKLNVVDVETKEVKTFYEFDNNHPVYTYTIEIVANQVVVGTSIGLFVFEKDRDQYNVHYVHDIYKVSDIFVDKSSRVWIASEKLYLFDASSKSLRALPYMYPLFQNGTINVVEQITETLNGTIVLAGPVFGITWLPQTHEYIKFPATSLKQQSNMILDAVSITENKAVVMTQDELSVLDFDSGLLQPLKSHLNIRNINAIEASSNNEIAIVERNRILRATVNELELKIHAGDIRFGNDIKNAVELASTLYVLTQDGAVYALDKQGKKIAIPSSFTGNQIFSAAGRLFVVDYYNGLFSLRENATWVKYDHSELLETMSVECASSTLTGSLYFCTSGNGVVVHASESNKLVESKLNDITQSHFARAMFIDEVDNIWLTTNSGLFRTNAGSNWIQRISESEGIVDIDFEYNGIYSSKSGEHLLLVGDKLNYLISLKDVNKILDEYLQSTSKMLVTQVSNFAGSGEDEGYTAKLGEGVDENYTLVESDVYLTEMHFAANDAIEHRYLDFESRLLGLSDVWRPAPEGNASATFSTLPFGDYEFQVRAINKRSQQVQPITALKIRVLPPFWMTSHAFLGYALALGACVVVLFLWQRSVVRVRKLELAKAVEEQAEEDKTLIDNLNLRLAAKSEQFTVVSHEMRTPLNIIIGWVDNLLGDSTIAQHHEVLRKVGDNGVRLKLLVDQMLELERLDGHTEQVFAVCDVKSSVNNAVESFMSIARLKSHTLERKGKAALYVGLPKKAFDKIVINLLANALKYTPNHGFIIISYKQKGKQVELAVTDSGDGIPDDQKEYLFERFTRLKKHEEIEGSGVGLALVKQLVNSCGGSIEVESEISKGATFKVLLPIASEEDYAEYQAAIAPSNPADSSSIAEQARCAEHAVTEPADKADEIDLESDKKRILVVDDSRELRDLLWATFSGEYECIRAANGKEAYDIAKSLLPDAIVSDIIMPRFDGFDLLTRIKNNVDTENIPVVFISGKADEEVQTKALREKAAFIFPKPVNTEQLLITVENLIENRESIAHEADKQFLRDSQNAGIDDWVLPKFTSEKYERFYTRLLVDASKHYGEESYNAEVAGFSLACSDRHINRQLNIISDINFGDFIRLFRLHKSRQLLGGLSDIGQVAYDVGFSSPSYFGSCFKKEYGMTPTQFREKMTVVNKMSE